MKNKRGLSTVIATLIIVLLVIVASGIIWMVIRDLIEKNAAQISLSKITTNLEIESIKTTGNNLNVKVKRGSGQGTITGLKFIIYDGEHTTVIDKTDISIKEFESKTFILNYTGEIKRISVAPILVLESGKEATGDISDTYYISQKIVDSGDEEESCTPQCSGLKCGYDGCSGNCGNCEELYGEGYFCNDGACTTEQCEPDCSLALTTCTGETFSDGCNGVCYGELEPECTGLLCGASLNQCGGTNSCGTCAEGYCNEGICAPICETGCTNLKCGPDPNDCQENCGLCDTGAGEWCDAGICSVEECTPNCGINNCGPVPNGCGNNCGLCDTGAGEFCDNGICATETSINSGTVYSTWPINTGIYFDSPDLPKSGANYADKYVKFTTGLENRCLQIRELITPVIPAIYNLSHIRFITASTAVQSGDNYEIWESYEGCTI